MMENRKSEGGVEMGKIEKLTQGTMGGPVFVYVQDGRVIRLTTIEFDSTDETSIRHQWLKE